jgi:hypothetical protein
VNRTACGNGEMAHQTNRTTRRLAEMTRGVNRTACGNGEMAHQTNRTSRRRAEMTRGVNRTACGNGDGVTDESNEDECV